MQKYTNEAPRSSGGGRQKRDAGGTTNYEGYEKQFYEELKTKGGVDKFLEKLSNEEVCKRVEDDKGGKIHFEKVNSGNHSGGDGSNKTFYRSDYCQPCPHCGMKKGSNGNFVKKREDDQCKSGKLYEPNKDANPTPITILKSGEKHDDIKQKIDDFCKTEVDESLYAAWKCYKHNEVYKVKDKNDDDEDEVKEEDDLKGAGGLCILENKNKKNESGNNSSNEPEQFQKTFNDFFYYWVVHMLKDSIYWRTEKVKGCLQNGKKKCGNQQCKVDCDCFKRWKGELLTSIKEGYGNSQETEGIRKILEEDEKEQEAAGETDDEKKNTIDKLLNHEDKDAKQCIEKHNNCQDPPPKQEGDTSGARILQPATEDHSASDEEEEEEEEEEIDLQEPPEEGTEATASEGPKEVEPP
ncbi:hypothetical protein PFTANZ_06382, partial [Plasmodium falciparum Tanzania (2000708)]